jgi:hypothetical protein
MQSSTSTEITMDQFMADLEELYEQHDLVLARRLHPYDVPGWYDAMEGVLPPLTAPQASALLYRWWSSSTRAHVLAEWAMDYVVTAEALRSPIAVGGPPLILDIWSDLKRGGADTRTWVGMFKMTGFVSDGQPQPTSPITVYRGGGHWRRMSWTTNIECAHHFAEWTSGDRTEQLVFQADVAPTSILGICDDRGEGEVIVNPYCLKGFRSRRPDVSCLGPYDQSLVDRWRAQVREHNLDVFNH